MSKEDNRCAGESGRRRGFLPGRVEFVSPRMTLPVSVTGSACALNCAHCGGHYLRGMAGLEEALGRRGEKAKSFLVSGGYTAGGRVPLRESWAELKKLAQRGPLNLHTGLAAPEDAPALGDMARVISFDFVVDRAVINGVYGLRADPEDYLRSYRHLRRYCRVVPHLCIGIMGGRIGSEFRALEILRREGAEAISFIVLRPTPGTAFAGVSPPSPKEIAAVLTRARALFPRTPLHLGCMRPGGRHREKLDCLALKAGIDKIVQPTAPARALAAEMGLQVFWGEECCAL